MKEITASILYGFVETVHMGRQLPFGVLKKPFAGNKPFVQWPILWSVLIQNQ